MMNTSLLQLRIVPSVVAHDKRFDSIWWIIQYTIDTLIVTAAAAGAVAAVRSATVSRVIDRSAATIICD